MNKILYWLKQLSWSFWLIVALPTALAIIYFGAIASERYVSVSNFVVRSPQKSTSVSGLSAFLQNVGFSRSTDDSYVVNDFVLSRDAMSAMEKTLGLRQRYSNTKIDWFSRFDPFRFDQSSENFYQYYQDKVKISLDSASSISTLTVRAYSAQDAYEINEHLLQLAESLVNKLNERGRQDMISSSENNVRNAEDRVQAVSRQLVEFRGSNQIFDIEKQSTLQMQLISKLQDQLILVKTQLSQIQAVTPENPQIAVLKERERVINKDIVRETQKVLGGSGSLNQKTIEYEKLMLEKDFATKQLAAALATLEQNRQEADKKQLYLERIAQPQKPDSAIEPSRLKNILSVFLLSLIALGVFKMLNAGIREHQE